MAAGSLDFGLGSGPDMIFPMKGSPEIVVANMAGPPLLLSIIVPWDSAITTTDGLKGKGIKYIIPSLLGGKAHTDD